MPDLSLNSQNINTVVPPYAQFHFLWFQLPIVNHGLLKYYMENSRNKNRF